MTSKLLLLLRMLAGTVYRLKPMSFTVTLKFIGVLFISWSFKKRILTFYINFHIYIKIILLGSVLLINHIFSWENFDFTVG